MPLAPHRALRGEGRRRPWAWALWLVGTLSCGSESPAVWDGVESTDALRGGAAAGRAQGKGLGAFAVIGGEPAGKQQFGATGALLYAITSRGSQRRPMGAMLCTGTLVAPDVVLAAAHCRQPALPEGGSAHILYFFSLEPDVSSFGPHALELPSDAMRVARIEVHPGYQPGEETQAKIGHTNDLALFYLEKPLSAPPVTVPDAEQAEPLLRVGKKVAIVGYGRQRATMYAARDDGVKMHGRSTLSDVGRFELEVGRTDDDAFKCFGDSGGPTFVAGPDGAWWLIGITSRGAAWTANKSGLPGPACRSGGIDTRVDAYRQWVDERMEQDCRTGARPACQAPFVGLAPPPRPHW